MSYDLYCYRSEAAEAQSIIESLNADEEAGRTSQSSGIKERVAAALIQHNPKLRRFEFDDRKIAESQTISENEARARYQHIQLDPPNGDLAIQRTVYDDHVFMTAPYWYQSGDANRIFHGFLDYARVIHKTAGYLVYDPREIRRFNPQQTESFDHAHYSHVVARMPEIIASAKNRSRKKTLVDVLVVLFQGFRNCTREFIGATRGCGNSNRLVRQLNHTAAPIAGVRSSTASTSLILIEVESARF